MERAAANKAHPSNPVQFKAVGAEISICTRYKVAGNQCLRGARQVHF